MDAADQKPVRIPIVAKPGEELYAAISRAARAAHMTRGNWLLAAADEKLAREGKAKLDTAAVALGVLRAAEAGAAPEEA